MKSKVIKKIFRILLYFVGVLLFFFISLYFAIRSPGFQTWAANRVGWYLSSQWQTTVRVDGVNIEFWKKIVLEGIYIEDQHQDTLLYAGKLKLDIGTINTKNHKIIITDLELQNATVKLKEYKGDSVLNLQFLINEFTSTDTVTSGDSINWNIAIKGIKFNNVRFLYRMENDVSQVQGINFSDLEANYVNGIVSDLRFNEDTTYCTINSFSFIEKSGFILKKLSTRGSLSPVHLSLDELWVMSNRSNIVTDLSFQYKTYNDYNHFIDSVKMKLDFRSSTIELADVAYFAPELFGINKKVFLDGAVSGKVSELKGRNIWLMIGKETTFKGDFDMTGLPRIDETFMSFEAKELTTSKAGIESIPLPPFNEEHFISLPNNIALFGQIRFKGNFTGFYNDFVSYGKFNTSLGFISTDISLKEDTVTKNPVYHGKFACKDFDLGRFFENEKLLGKISMNAIVDGKGFSKSNAVSSVEGVVSSLDFKGYNYKNIELKGTLARNIFDGVLAVNDENFQMNFSGNVDFSQSPIHVNFASDISKANLSLLNFVESKELISIKAKINVNAIGNNIDDVTGQMRLDSIVYFRGPTAFNFKNVQLSIQDSAGVKRMDLTSSMADAHLKGKFKLLEIAASMNDFLSNYLPTYIARQKEKVKAPVIAKQYQNFSFDIKLRNTDIVTKAFMPSLRISPAVSVQGNFNEANHDLSFVGDFPSVTYEKYKFKKCQVLVSSMENELMMETTCQRFTLSDSVWIDSINIASVIAQDTAKFRFQWHNNSKKKYEGDMPGYIAFSAQPAGRAGDPIVKLKFLPSIITIADTSWQLNSDNEIVKDSSFISVKNLEFVSGGQRVKLEGNISEIKEEQMYLLLTDFSLANFNTYLTGTGMSVYGSISGSTSIGNIYDKAIFGSTIDIKNLKVNKEAVGDGNFVSLYDIKKDMISFNGGFHRGGGDNLKFTGNYYPSKKDNSLEVDAELNDFRLEFFEPFIRGNFENLKGVATADLKLRGTPKEPLLSGKVKARVDNIHVNYLGTNYHFDGDVTIEPNSFDFANLVVLDANNNKAEVVNGKIFHVNYKDFQLDFDLKVNKFLCLNTTEKDNPVYYGKVFTTGIFNIFGFLDRINLSAAVKTDRARNSLGKYEYSQLFIPLSGSEEVGENSFISFVKHDTTLKVEKYKVNSAGFTMDFRLQPTSDAQVQLIFDEKVGDVIKANGSGDIRMVINQFGDFKMYGDYIVNEGDYLFTLKNVVNKKFRLLNGGSIHWSGSPEDADINMSAIYELRTSLTPLFLTHEHTEAIRKRYPIDCVMKLTGKLLEPDIAFDIKMPTVDDFTRQQAYDKFNNSESEINKQVFSLMFTNSFSPPPGQIQETAGGPGAGTVTSTEMLSNQLSNWLSQISNEFDVGVHYRLGDEVNSDQVELALSTQLFNDKVSIDGSVANSTNENAASVVGDINVDYKLTEDGKFRAKAYNRANEGDILNTQKGPYTQGLGVFYREEFETWKELYLRFMHKFTKHPKP